MDVLEKITRDPKLGLVFFRSLAEPNVNIEPYGKTAYLSVGTVS